jgi:hypothetical protein
MGYHQSQKQDQKTSENQKERKEKGNRRPHPFVSSLVKTQISQSGRAIA